MLKKTPIRLILILSFAIIAIVAVISVSNSNVLATTPTPTPTITAIPTPTPGGLFYLKVNFQPTITPTPQAVYTCNVPYVTDNGYLFGPRGNGYTYGWNFLHTTQVATTNKNTDFREDTRCCFLIGGIWEAMVPMTPYNTFEVTVCVGDAITPTTNTINVEGVSFWANLPLRSSEFRKYTTIVTVNDGRLTIDALGSPDKATRINYVHIHMVDPHGTPTPTGVGTH